MSNQFHFKAMWIFANKKGTHRSDFMAPSLSELLRMLHKSEGVSTTTCSEIYVHEIASGGRTREVFTHDGKTDSTNFDYSTKEDNVVNIVEAVLRKAAANDDTKQKVKPHIRLKTTANGETVYPHTTASYGRYKAYEAH